MKKQTKEKVLTTTNIYAQTPNGEIVNFGPANITTQKEKLNKNFFMLFDSVLTKEGTGIFELDFIYYLLKYMTNKNTVSFIKNEKIAKDLGVCRQTVESLKKKLRDKNLIKYKAEGIFINPEWIFRGNAYKRSECIVEYKNFEGIGSKKIQEEE